MGVLKEVDIVTNRQRFKRARSRYLVLPLQKDIRVAFCKHGVTIGLQIDNTLYGWKRDDKCS